MKEGERPVRFCQRRSRYLQKQGTDLIDLRLTWKEMENLIFGSFLRIFGEQLISTRPVGFAPGKRARDPMDLRLTQKEMENLIFGSFLRIFETLLSILETFLGILQKFVLKRRLLSSRDPLFFEALEATTASKLPQSSNFTSDLEFVAQNAYAAMFIWAVQAFFGSIREED